jgi:uncharacterized protein with GYD domain
MPHYLVKASYSSDTWAAMAKNPDDRETEVRALLAGLGGKLEAFYFAFGESDVYAIGELPDNVTASAMAIAVTATGAMRSFTTIPLVTPAEAMEAMKKAGKLVYDRPGD